MSRIYFQELPNNILSVRIDTQDTVINTFSGQLDIRGAQVKNYDFDNSIVNLWIERPDQNDGLMSAMIPNGYTGANGELFKIEFQKSTSTKVIAEITEQKFYLNDGKGTEITSSSTEFVKEMQSYPQGIEIIFLILVIMVTGVIYFKKKR